MYIHKTPDLNNDVNMFLEQSQTQSNYLGIGGKAIFQLNDFAVFFELRKYFPDTDSSPGFTQLPLISFGAIASGTILNR